ncbi:MAG: ABC transporter ATP-binding protein [Anaerolineae bacterium]|jgi:ABC-2 type transport system ATP-binding protein|nr:MAG: ABC transporter ATP-binding protein [Anaerolineae bacterium]
MIKPLIVENLTKVYTVRQRKGLFRSQKVEVQALKDISLEVEEGEIFGLLGPNGAGKTTLIKIITTLLLPTSGRVFVNGFDVIKQENQVRASVGCMLMGERGLYWKLTGRENLEYFAALYHFPPKKRKERADEILNLIQLTDIADRTVETYSSGQKMKLAFGKALIQDAPLLVLDEPTNTLDVPSASELRAIVRQLNQQGKTVIYTTHIMAEADALCNRLAIIDRGELLALGTPAELKASLNSRRVIHIEGVISAQAVEEVLRLPMVSNATRSARNGATLLTVVSYEGVEILPALIRVLVEQGAHIQKVLPEEPTLEDVFIAKTGRTLAEDTRIST